MALPENGKKRLQLPSCQLLHEKKFVILFINIVRQEHKIETWNLMKSSESISRIRVQLLSPVLLKNGKKGRNCAPPEIQGVP